MRCLASQGQQKKGCEALLPLQQLNCCHAVDQQASTNDSMRPAVQKFLQADLRPRMSVFAQTDSSREGQVQSQRQHLLTASQLWRLLEGQLVSIAGNLAPCMLAVHSEA